MVEETTEIRNFKEAMANYPTGVSVVTAFDEDNQPMGMTINSFASVSIDPLLILWSIDNNVSLFEKFMKVDKFTVNILAEDQAKVAGLFASHKKKDRFSQCGWHTSEDKLPILEDAIATLQCHVHKRVEAGDHIIFLGEIFKLDVADKKPLLYHQRTMGPIPPVFYEK